MADTQSSTHTPPPWHVNGVDTIMSVNCTIAKVFHPERDAQLLAAAPELLDALQFTLQSIARLVPPDFTDGWEEMEIAHFTDAMDRARAAVEKAVDSRVSGAAQ